jgi:hypothetical protein
MDLSAASVRQRGWPTIDQIAIYDFHINGVESAGSVSVGPQFHLGRTAIYKNVQGNGQIDGDNSAISVGMAWVHDPDAIDAPAWSFTYMPVNT